MGKRGLCQLDHSKLQLHYGPSDLFGGLQEIMLPMGDTLMGGMAVEDTGPVVLCLLKSPEEYIGRVIGLSTGKLTEAEYATVLSQQTGKTVEASKISPEEYVKRGSPGAKGMAAMFRFYALKPDRNVDLNMNLNPKARAFHQRVADRWRRRLVFPGSPSFLGSSEHAAPQWAEFWVPKGSAFSAAAAGTHGRSSTSTGAGS